MAIWRQQQQRRMVNVFTVIYEILLHGGDYVSMANNMWHSITRTPLNNHRQPYVTMASIIIIQPITTSSVTTYDNILRKPLAYGVA